MAGNNTSQPGAAEPGRAEPGFPGPVPPPAAPAVVYSAGNGAALDVNLGGTWTGVPSTGPGSLRNQAVQITRGRQDLRSTISPAQATMTLDNRDNRWSIRRPDGPWYGLLVQSSPCRVSVPSARAGIPCYLRLETDDASYASTPDSGALQITSGTLSVRWDGKITDWTGNHVLIAKWGATGQSWILYTEPDGAFALAWNNGSGDFFIDSPLPVPYFGQRIALRADYNLSTDVVTFYTAPTMSGSWTQLGPSVAVVAVATGIVAGAGQPVQVGAAGAASFGFTGMYGEVYEAQIWSTSTLVADPVFTVQGSGATSFSDTQGNRWTLAGTAELSGRLFRFHGELAVLPKAATANAATGVGDVAVAAQGGGVLRRLTQATLPTNSAMYRAYVRLPANLQLAAYWPAEDSNLATQIGPAVGQHAMTNAGLNMAASSDFLCSAPIPVMNGATASALVDPNSVSWTDNVVRFLLAVPSGDDTNGAVVCQFTTAGTAALVQVVYSTGSTLTMSGYNGTGSQIFTHNITFTNNPLVGHQVRVSIEVLGSGSFNMWVLPPGGSATGGGTTWSGTIGGVTSVAFGGGLVGSAMGHFSVQGVSDGINDLSQPLNAWIGETAASRYARLCSEESIACRITGPPTRSQQMGAQTIETVVDLLQECEDTDQGLQTEPRQVTGLGYVTQWALCSQPAVTTVPFPSGIDPSLAPTSDDTTLVNDATMQGTVDGATVRQQLLTGPMSVTPAANGWLPASSTASSPGGGSVIAQTASFPPGTYTANWVVALSGTVGAADANNFVLVATAGNQTIATSVNTGSAGTYAQAPVTFTTTVAGTLAIQNIANGTFGSVYKGIIAGSPPGAGRFDTEISVNPASDAEMISLASWYVHARTADNDRYPALPFQLARGTQPASLPLADIGSFVELTSTPEWTEPGPIKQLVVGYTETIGPQPGWMVSFNGVPETPFETGIADDLVYGRCDTSGTIVDTAATYGASTFLADTYAGPLWSLNSSDYPFDLIIGGMVITVSGCAGASSPQTFTVSAWGVNGVQKNLTPGQDVRLAHPTIAAL